MEGSIDTFNHQNKSKEMRHKRNNNMVILAWTAWSDRPS